MFKNSSILITGGTGSFGKEFVSFALKNLNFKRLIIFSRDEMKQWEMSKDYPDDPRIRFFIGDVRDKERLHRALDNVDFVVHAAATKIVPIAEYNPFECVKTNILGAMNLIDASIDQKVKKIVALSTDKASSPINLYGATKLASDKLFTASSSSYAGGHRTTFSVVRYGNVIGSRGSLIPHLLSLKDKKKLPITDQEMTRFVITLNEAVQMVLFALNDMNGGEIYVKKIPSVKVIDILRAIEPKTEFKIIGIRPGEKLHEQMISSDEARSTFEYLKYYKVLPQINDWSKDKNRIKKGKLVPEGFEYASNKNHDWLTIQDLHKLIQNAKDHVGKF